MLFYKNHKATNVLLIAVFTMFALCGCSYQAQLLDGSQFNPGATVAVQCRINEKPVVRVSESGDFLFWATGPGPIAAAVAYVVNESNNGTYRRKLAPVLQQDCYHQRFQQNLQELLEQKGFQVEKMQIEYESLTNLLKLGLQNFDITKLFAESGDYDYLLQIKAAYGLFDSEAQCISSIEGKLTRVSDNKVVWKNKLSFEGRTGAEHKAFGDGKKAVRQWTNGKIILQDSMLEAIDGVFGLLAQEFTPSQAEQNDTVSVLKLKPGGRVKGNIIDQSQTRVVVRLKGGSVRSIPARELVSVK